MSAACQDDNLLPNQPGPVATGARKRLDRQPLSRSKRLVFCAILLILSWLLCEVACFVLFWLLQGRPFSWKEMQDQRRERIERSEMVGTGVFSQVHPYVGFVEEPTADSGVRRSRDGKPIPVSEFGYIDEKEPLQTRGPDKVVVAITGGSVASFFAVNGTEQLEAELSRSPAFGGKRFVFVNLALGGYKQPQQLMTLAYLLSLGAEFDLVLNIDGFNEVALYELENASRQVFPAFPRSWHLRVSSTDPAQGLTRGRVLVIDEQRNGLARWYSRAPWCYSVVCNLLWGVRDKRLALESFRIVEEHYKSTPSGGPYVVTGPRREFASRQELFEHLAAIWANSSRLMDRLCHGQGIRYYHFLQPNQYLPGSKPIGRDEKRLAISEDHPYRQGVETGYPLLIRAGRALRDSGISFLDLTEIFRDHPETIYSDTCCHVNQTGQELMARAIARAILDDHPTPAQVH
jgi:hypothetical protein